MCMNCGCGELDTRHKDTDIVREDIQSAAKGQGSSMEETARNLSVSLQRLGAMGNAGSDQQHAQATGSASAR